MKIWGVKLESWLYQFRITVVYRPLPFIDFAIFIEKAKDSSICVLQLKASFKSTIELDED